MADMNIGEMHPSQDSIEVDDIRDAEVTCVVRGKASIDTYVLLREIYK